MTRILNRFGVYQRDMELPDGLSYRRVGSTQIYQIGKWISNYQQRGGDWWPFFVHASDLPEAVRKRKTKIPGN